jgi:hypothetical protein
MIALYKQELIPAVAQIPNVRAAQERSPKFDSAQLLSIPIPGKRAVPYCCDIVARSIKLGSTE